MRIILLLILTFSIILNGCGNEDSPGSGGKIVAVSSINIIGDIVKNIGGDKVESISICGVGVDPHTYHSKPEDVRTIAKSDIAFINGFALEHWMEELIDNAGGDRPKIVVTDGITPLTDEKGYGDPDPHAWFDVKNAKVYAQNIANALIEIDKENEQYYRTNLENYLKQLDELDGWIISQVESLPKEKRVLITSHDAFRYFGKAYGFEVHGLQGLSTEAKVQTEDVTRVIDLIKARGLKAVFIETSVNPKLLEQVSSETGAKVGGTLYSDSIGNEGTEGGSYIGAVRSNVSTIINSLK
jgi:ABC-type Zn uptake system ZnuABC Zn-binding protein ZnuA